MGRLCIGFFPIGGAEWMGGRNILRYILSGLRTLPDLERPETILLVTQTVETGLECLVDRVVPIDWGTGNLWQRISSRLRNETQVNRFLQKQGIDAIFCQQVLDERSRIPILSYIPDLQHFRLPEMFSPEENAARDQYFRFIAKRATRVVLTSQATLNDYREFVPQYSANGRFLPVVAQIGDETRDGHFAPIYKKYHLPERFFYLPNQFWKHKNHRVVIRALGILRATYPEITVACTGLPHDPRHLTHFSDILQEVATQDVHNQFRLLGMVPGDDVQALVRQSLAVVQPSLFEGWSATVEEARSLGKPLILSDIPIFREKELSCATFFNPTSPEELSHIMRKGWETLTPGPDLKMECSAREDVRHRTLTSGRRFLEIVRESVSSTG